MHSPAPIQVADRESVAPPDLIVSDQPDRIAVAEPSDDDAPTIDPVRLAPPWLVSMFVHIGSMLLLALLVIPSVVNDAIEMEINVADEFGQQLEEDVALFTLEDAPVQESLITPTELPAVEDPLLQPDKIKEPSMDAEVTTSEFETPFIGAALTGREPGMKEVLLAAFGGNKLTEEAVQRGLEWLARNQQRNGTWSLKGPYANGGANEDVTSATAMALLAFQGAGHTTKRGQYQEVVEKGWRALLAMQDTNGDFWRGRVRHYRLYSQAQATIAVCEIYGMTHDSRFREPAQSAIDYAVKIQGKLGGWRYEPGRESDTSVTGWFVMALQSARMAGLHVPSETWRSVDSYLDRAAKSNGATYAYLPEEEATYAITAEGLLCRQYLGWKRNDSRLLSGIRHLTALPMDWDDKNVYYWYYASQVYHHMGGDIWEEWNNSMREVIPEMQTRAGSEAGSWSPRGDRWATQGGRLYTTCLSIYMLEIYYRHLPIYHNVYE